MTETPLTLSLDPGPGHLWLNLPALRRTNTLVQGSTRAGKSYLVRWLCEQVFGQVQQLIFDVEGEYVSLTEKYDYALFGAETQVKPDPDSAPLLMRRLLDTGNSAIFDLSEMASPEQQRFTAAAAAELVRASPREPRSVLIIIDEAQRLAPQAGQGEAASTTQVRDLANRGLKRGLALLLATQRHSAVDAGLRGALANLVVGGTPPGPDMKSSGEKLGFTAAERRQLANLRAGEFFFLGPAFGDPEAGRQVALARAGDVQTRHLDAGEARVFTPPPASDAVQSLYDLLGVEAPVALLGDTAKPTLTSTPERKASAKKEAVAPADCAAEPPAPETVKEPAALPVATIPSVSAQQPPALEAASVPVSRSRITPVLTRRVETALAEIYPWPVTPAQLGLLGLVSVTPAEMENLVRSLRRQGACAWDGERLTLTAERAARSPRTPLDAAGYRRLWKSNLGRMASRLLDVLENADAGGLTWAEWQSQAAYAKGGAVSAARGRLMQAGFVVQQKNRYAVSETWPREEAESPANAPLLKIS